MKKEDEKKKFLSELKKFADTLYEKISYNNEWTIRGFIDIFKNIYPISTDTKIISKILELHLFPIFLEFSNNIGYNLELPNHQNYYPDLTFISKEDKNIKFAVSFSIFPSTVNSQIFLSSTYTFKIQSS